MASLISRPLDVVVFGATGDTGSAAVRLLYHHATKVHLLKWAPACRNLSKLHRNVLDPLLASAPTGTQWTGNPIQADSNDLQSLVRMCNQTRVVVACAGPYSQYGEKVVAACILSGCHYVDVTGETDWVQAMKKRYNKAATTKGVSIVSFCGYDSVPMDLSAWLIADALNESHTQQGGGGDHATLIETFATSSQKGGGGIPTGTINTVLTKVNQLRYKFSLGLLGTAPPPHPRVLPGSTCNGLPTGNNNDEDVLLTKQVKALTKKDLQFNRQKLYKSPLPNQSVYSAPHFMDSINTPIVHSTAEQMGFAPFEYHERMLSGGRKAWEQASGSVTAYVPVVMNFIAMCCAAPFVMTPFFENLVWWYVRRTNSGGQDVNDEVGHNMVQRLMTEGEDTGYVGVTGYGVNKSKTKIATTNFESDYDAGIGFTMLSALSIAGELNARKTVLVPHTNGFETPVCAIGGTLLKQALNDAGVRVHLSVSSGSKL